GERGRDPRGGEHRADAPAHPAASGVLGRRHSGGGADDDQARGGGLLRALAQEVDERRNREEGGPGPECAEGEAEQRPDRDGKQPGHTISPGRSGASPAACVSKPQRNPAEGENCELTRKRSPRTTVVRHSRVRAPESPSRSMWKAAAPAGTSSCCASDADSVTAWITSCPWRGASPIRSAISR